MANVLLGVTGSVAAILTPALYGQLKRAGHRVKVVATQAALYFFDPLELDAVDGKRNPEVVILDEDEWPGREAGRRWQRGDPVLHIELRRWAEVLLIAPLDANTLAKLAGGLSDNCLTCVYRAWDPARPVVLAPAMNTLMWEHPLTNEHLQQVARTCRRLKITSPATKQLACGDVGIGAMAPVEDIVAAVSATL
jgi:phosphopantothenoylcysteine decarboxylase